jgi:2-methylcitrate dehydratase PrpD
VVRTRDGQEHVVDVPYPPGFSRGRLDAETVIEKFHALTAPHLTQAARSRIIEAAMTLENSPSCAELMKAVAAA